MKLPSFQFYPCDWMKDPALRSVSLEARGLWMDMLCLMFESGRRGYLEHATGKPVNEEQLARMTGCSTRQVSRLLRELEDSGVFSRTDDGTVFSRRMVKDEETRQAKSAAGKLGGNPRLVGGVHNHEVNHPVKQEAKQKGGSSSSTSSSASASASSSEEPPPQPPEGGLDAASLFMIFWEAYPLKAKRPKAWAEFAKLKPDRALLDTMLEAIDRQRQSAAWRKESGRYIPHPASWVANRQWEDDVGPGAGSASVWDDFIGEAERRAS